MRNLRVSVHKCPNCGAAVEIFSDEMRVKCHKCGKYVHREKVPSCIEWCTSARECLGEERWKQLKESVEMEKPGAANGVARGKGRRML